MMTEFEITLVDYRILSTGADSGHFYISTEIEFQGQKRKLTAFFLNKSFEKELEKDLRLSLKGDLIDEGNQYSLMLLNTTILKKENNIRQHGT